MTWAKDSYFPWAYDDEIPFPTDIPAESFGWGQDVYRVRIHLRLFKLLREYVITNGPIREEVSLLPGEVAFWNKVKTGVDIISRQLNFIAALFTSAKSEQNLWISIFGKCTLVVMRLQQILSVSLSDLGDLKQARDRMRRIVDLKEVDIISRQLNFIAALFTSAKSEQNLWISIFGKARDRMRRIVDLKEIISRSRKYFKARVEGRKRKRSSPGHCASGKLKRVSSSVTNLRLQLTNDAAKNASMQVVAETGHFPGKTEDGTRGKCHNRMCQGKTLYYCEGCSTDKKAFLHPECFKTFHGNLLSS
eukprot:CAMPEP_0119155098 /NCGR_PEP_ID=MMETSP1310-20130426/51566_1 /TAXON_ID=464262 /ORGANISM="Genus nov. species nov., Strain RCC2339" /LENGTH=304 /DNA_ID=CAMNT_0007147685 /DNA_START=97 /DNA_END=1012 /DNA_ORIENTATION=-